MEHICKNCALYDKKNKLCNVIVLIDGEKQKIPTNPNEYCFFEIPIIIEKEIIINNKLEKIKETYIPADDIKQIRFWTEDEKGNPAEKGIVKIEYPNDII